MTFVVMLIRDPVIEALASGRLEGRNLARHVCEAGFNGVLFAPEILQSTSSLVEKIDDVNSDMEDVVRQLYRLSNDVLQVQQAQQLQEEQALQPLQTGYNAPSSDMTHVITGVDRLSLHSPHSTLGSHATRV